MQAFRFPCLSAKSLNCIQIQKAKISFKSISSSKWVKIITAGGLITVSVIGLASPVYASVANAHPTTLHWSHSSLFSSYDHASLRRGYQVYKEVCAACHSMKFIYYRHLVNTILTEEETKEDAAAIMVMDGPGDNGKMFERPGRLSDLLPSPYANEEIARLANSGAVPPDLTYVIKAREGNENYVFHLLTGYMDPPPGRTVEEGQYYNPYFNGGALAMPQMLFDEGIEYADGTPATVSQLAKDVTSFLCWTSDRHFDQRKLTFAKVCVLLLTMTSIMGFFVRHRWSNIKTRKLLYKNRPLPKHV